MRLFVVDVAEAVPDDLEGRQGKGEARDGNGRGEIHRGDEYIGLVGTDLMVSSWQWMLLRYI